MCLIVNNSFDYELPEPDTGEEIDVYKIVLKTYNGYMTPFRYYPIIFKEDERGVKGKELVSNKELKFLLGRKKTKIIDGYFHVLRNVKNYPFYDEYRHKILKAKIPADALFYEHENGNELCADKIIVSDIECEDERE